MLKNIYKNNITIHKLFGFLVLNLSISTMLIGVSVSSDEFINEGNLIFLTFGMLGTIISTFFLLKKSWARKILSFFLHIVFLTIVAVYFYQLPSENTWGEKLFLTSFCLFILFDSMIGILVLQSKTMKDFFN